MGNIVEFKNVYKSYGKKDVLTDLNVSIPKGKIIGLLGPNGSGKSTMIKLINGLLQPNKGEIKINGMKPSIKTKKIVSYLPERTYLNDWMKVKDILEGLKFEVVSNKNFDEKVVIFSNFPDEELQMMVSIAKVITENPIMAVVTETSKEWQFNYLVEHLLEEREWYRSMQGGKA